MVKKLSIPGVVRPTEAYRSTQGKGGPKPIQEKREVVIRSIERFRRGDPRSYRLEQFDHEIGAPVIRVLYGSVPLALFDGKPAAVIDPKADRDKLWDAIIEQVRAGEFDQVIEQATQQMLRSIQAARSKKGGGRQAA